MYSIALLLCGLLACSDGAGTPGAEPPRLQADATTIRLQVASDWLVDASAARTQAEVRLADSLHTVVAASGMGRPNRAHRADIATGLSLDSSARRVDNLDERFKPYGPLYRHRIDLALPRQAVDRWARQCHEASTIRWRRQIGGRATLLGLCGVGAAVASWADRRSLGYRRGIILLALVGWLVVLMAAWRMFASYVA